MADPIVYGPAYSAYTRTVRLALEEKGVAYRLEEVDIFGDAHKEPTHLARHPFGKVPAFEHDGFALYETRAITRYVDESVGGAGLQPADARARARMGQAIGIIDSYAYPAWITAIFVQRLVVPSMGGEADSAVIEDALPRAQTSVSALDGLIGDNAYVAGDALSLADLHLVPIYDYFRQTPEGEGMLGRASNLARWWAAMSARESVVKTTPQLG